MLKIVPAPPGQWRQLAGFAILFLAAPAAAWALDLYGVGSFFEPYFAGFSPTSVFGVTDVIGVISLRALHVCGWVGTRQRDDLMGVDVAVMLATISVITVDRFVGIKVIHVPMPWSLLFYPTVALVVEVFFHTLPLALMFASLRAIERSDSDRIGWMCIIVVSLLEPTY
jgi:hypothetical protein